MFYVEPVIHISIDLQSVADGIDIAD